MKNLIVFQFIVFTLTIIGFGQEDLSTYGDRRKEFDERTKTLDTWVRTSEKQSVTHNSGLPSKSNKLSKEDKIKLAPQKEILDKYAEFLKKRKTGIVKLLDLLSCNNKVVNVNDTKCLETPQIIGNGSLYSFRARSYVDMDSIDIRLANGTFYSAWSPLNYSLFSELGGISVDTFDPGKDKPSLKKFLVDKDISQITAQKKQFESGVKIKNLMYQTNVPAKKDTTYLLCSGSYNLRLRSFDEIVVVFRVIQKENDGSIVLIWKEL
jgi:hypothetical protein